MSLWITTPEKELLIPTERCPDAPFFHTWHRPSPTARSKTPSPPLSEQTAALHLWWASGRQPPHPPTRQTARTESQRGHDTISHMELHSRRKRQGVCVEHLKVEDAGVFLLKALVVRDNARQNLFVESQGGDGRQEPAVT